MSAYPLTAEHKPPKRRVSAAKRGSDPISRPARLWSGTDGNSSEAKFIRQLRAQLVRHVGNAPSVTQRIAIERAVMLATHLARIDAEALSTGSMSDHRRREYLACDSSLRRMLGSLGMKGVAEREESLAELMARPYQREPSPPAAPGPVLRSAETHAPTNTAEPPTPLPGPAAGHLTTENSEC